MFQLVRKSPTPLTDQLVEGLTAQIQSGRLTEGVRLPSIRLLARRTGVSAFTVTTAFERLLARGMIESRRGSGHFVAARRRSIEAFEVELGPCPNADPAIRFTQSSLDAQGITIPAGS